MSGLHFDKHSIGQSTIFLRQHSKVTRQTNQGQIIHRVGTLNEIAGLQIADCPTHFVYQATTIVLQKFFTGKIFLTDDIMQGAVQAIDNGSFRFTQGLLIGNLENTPIRIRSLPKQTTDGNSELINGIDHLVHILGHDQTRKMHHRRCPHARTQICRTRGKKPQFAVIGVTNGRFDTEIQGISDLPNASEVQTGSQDLNAQMILLVDHDATIPVLGENDPRPFLNLGEFRTDQMLFDEDLTIKFAKVIDFH